jgi:glycosyltransferase involved in cell wall biosynthesis
LQPRSILLRMVEIVIPVYNEQAALEPSVRRLHAFLSAELPFAFRITIADNASTDRTFAIGSALARELDEVSIVHLDRKGRGRALRATWAASTAEVVCYMDVDLSTDLRALLPLVAPLLSGRSDIAIGTRLAPGARVQRSARRELLSRTYNRLLHAVLHTGFTDAQCGFKAGRTQAVQALLPQVENDNWFFDTELLYLAERRGMRIHEVPVHWVEDPDSRVHLVDTVLEDLRGVARLRRRGLAGADAAATSSPALSNVTPHPRSQS